jgi:hypothetical protein
MPKYLVRAIFIVDGKQQSDYFEAVAKSARDAQLAVKEQIELLGRSSQKKITDIRVGYQRDRRLEQVILPKGNQLHRMRRLARKMKEDPVMKDQEKKILDGMSSQPLV